jgi:hypothetical protein
MSRMEETVERVLATGELPEMEFEPGVPVPVAFWDPMVLFILRRNDGSYHYLAADPSGTVSGGPLADELPDRSELELYGFVGMSGADAVIGFAPAQAVEVGLRGAGTRARVNPRNGAFLVGVAGTGGHHSDVLAALDGGGECVATASVELEGG